MKKILCLVLACIAICTLCSCSLLDTVKDKVESGFETLINQGAIAATGEATENQAGTLKVYDDRIVLTISTEDVRTKMNEAGITIDTIRAERHNADTAHMEYTLEYQYYIQLKVNEESKVAACKIAVTEDTINNNVEISIPIDADDMSVTIYELLQGASLRMEGRVQHGTDNTPIAYEQYYLNEVPENLTAKVLTMEDNRSTNN